MAVGPNEPISPADPEPEEGARGGGLSFPQLNTARITRQTRITARQAVRRRVPAAARHSFKADFGSLLLAGLYSGAVFPFATFLAIKRLHASNGLVSLMIAAPFLGNLLALFWARAMDGKNKVPFVTWSRMAAAFLVFLSFAVKKAIPFAMVISGAQIIGTIGTPAYAAIIKDVYPDSQRGRLLSFSKTGTVFGSMVSTLLAGWLLGFADFHYIFPVAALVGMVGASVFAQIQTVPAPEDEEVDAADETRGRRIPLPNREQLLVAARAMLPPVLWLALFSFLHRFHMHWAIALTIAAIVAWAPQARTAWHEVRATGRFVANTLGILKTDVAYRWFAFSVFTYGFGNLMHQPILPKLQANQLHVVEWHLSLLTVTSQIVTMAAYVYWGRYVDLKSPQRAVVVNVLLNTLVPFTYVLAGTVLPASPWSLLPAFVVVGVVNAGIDLSYFSAVLTFSGDDNVSQYQALQSFLVGVRGSIAPFIGGGVVWLLESHGLNLRWAFSGSICLMIAGALMQAASMGRQRREAE